MKSRSAYITMGTPKLDSRISIGLSNLLVQVIVYTLYESCQMLVHQPWSSDSPSIPSFNIQAYFISRPAVLATYILEQSVCYLLDFSDYVSAACRLFSVSIQL